VSKSRKIFFILVICHFYGICQDPQFSQYNEQPALLNPALTGAVTNLRVSLAHRKQWAGITNPFTTIGTSIEVKSRGRYKRTGKFGRSRSRTPGLIALGLAGYKDNAGDGKLTTMNGIMSLAVFIPAGKKNFFSAGLQAAMVQKKFTGGNLIYPDQFTGTGYDPALIPGEEPDATNIMYMDYAAGFLWTYGSDIKTFITHHETKARLGFSVYHLTRPTQQYFNLSQDYMYHKYVLHGDMIRSLRGTIFALAPSFLYQQQGKSSSLTGGLLLKAYDSNDTKITGNIKRNSYGLGMFYRTNDALIFKFLFELEEQYAFGISYDMNVSALKNYSRTGAWEFVLRYTPAHTFLYQKK
jgi:type IX secretion system PorP/SprF family membrane protein